MIFSPARSNGHITYHSLPITPQFPTPNNTNYTQYEDHIYLRISSFQLLDKIAYMFWYVNLNLVLPSECSFGHYHTTLLCFFE